MELTIGAWYNEPEYSFEFSSKILDFIQKAIAECVMAPLGLVENFPEKSLHVRVTTTAEQNQLEVKMGPFRENSTSVNCHLWFPYYPIVQADNPLEAYVEYFIQAIPLIFQRLGITEQQLNTAATMIRAEIINNPYYELTAEEKGKLKTDKTSTVKILKIPDVNKRTTGNNPFPKTTNWWQQIFGDN